MRARIVAFCNQKGGVGKTTTTFQIARAAVREGRRVLLVDLDPQGNLTSVAAAQTVEDGTVGLADALSARTPDTAADVTVDGVWPGLDLLPTAGTSLGAVRDELVVAGAGREGRLRTLLEAVSEEYDLILIDCAPSLDQLTINGLTAAHAVVVVTHSKLFSANGLGQLLETISQIRAYYNPRLEILGVIVNQHEQGTVSGQTWLSELEDVGSRSGFSVLLPVIPKRVLISDATEAARGLDEWGSGEGVALASLYSAHLATLEAGAA